MLQKDRVLAQLQLYQQQVWICYTADQQQEVPR